MKLLAATTGILGALLLALNISMESIAYILFLISSASWTAIAYLTEERELMYMNIVFTSINIIGLFSHN